MSSHKKNVNFEPDQKAVVLKSAKDLYFATQQLHEWISKDILSEEMAGVLPSLIESHFSDISKSLNYESVLTKEKEERHREIRNANGKIRELEKQIAEAKPIDGLKEQLYYLSRVVYDWWNEEGFHHVSDAGFTDSGTYKAKFCFMLIYLGSSYSDTPVTDKKNHQTRLEKFEEDGWDIVYSDSGREPELVDNDNNRKRLIELVESRFPSAKVVRTRNHYSDKRGLYTMRDIEVYIYDLHDIVREGIKA